MTPPKKTKIAAPKTAKAPVRKVAKMPEPVPTTEQARKSAEKLVGSLIRALLASRKRFYVESARLEKMHYSASLFDESRKTYSRYLDAEEKERILKVEPIGPTLVHVYTSGEGMGRNRYTCQFDRKEWKISAIDVMCGGCHGAGSCRWCEGKGCLDCQKSGRCVPCSGTGWAHWAK
jgi:hypothetical protein